MASRAFGPDSIVGLRLGHYVVVTRIGAGGMGEVYRARDEHLDRDVAIKVLPSKTFSDDSARKHFRTEALALSKLNHPNIATIHDFDTQQEIDFLVMEYVSGVTLSERIANHALPEKECTLLGLQLAEGLAAAHEQHVVHRDLKPNNLRLTPDGRLKILDFGLAKLVQPAAPAAEANTESETRTVAGTLPYMSPEQLQGRAVDARADIWAAGTVLYEMATGHTAFHEKTATATAGAILHKPVAPPGRLAHGLSPHLENIILKCLEKEAENRYQSAKELAVDLRRLSSASAGALVRTAEPKSRGMLVGAAIACVATLLSIAALLVALNIGGWRDRWLGHGGPPRISSLAVLPLANLSRDPEQDYFADGMTEALITDLAKATDLRVISRTSVMRYKGTQKLLPEIAGELHVDAVVEGSIQRSENKVRITAQLIRAATDQHLWADSYQRDLQDILALQDEVAHAITLQVEGRLSQKNEARRGSFRPINPEAYEAYLKGRYFWNKRDRNSLEKSLGYFNEAIAKDPNYALAYAGLADVYVVLDPDWGIASKEVNEKAKAAAQKALTIDDSLVEAHTSLATIYHNEWNWQGAEREFKRAIELNPSYATAHHWYSIYLATAARFDESVKEATKAVELDPLSLIISASLGNRLNEARRYEDAANQCRKTLDMDPNFGLAYLCIGISYVNVGRFKEGIPQLQKGTELLPGDPYSMEQLGIAYALSGDRARAREVLRKLQDPSQPHLPAYSIAMVYAGLADKEQTISWLKKGYEERNDDMIYLKIEPVLDPFRSDPRIQDLIRRVGFPP
jgi:serine/threonine protein kinase/TolB-like protein/Flp pilus assembly protein TadD